MEATELMIGDVVYVTPDKIGRVCTVNRSDTGRAFVLVKDERYIHSLVNITPIPITIEILEKNGFKENSFGIYELERQNLYLERCGDAYWFGRSFDGSDFYEYAVERAIKAKYVHELQHILRMCGQNDLADNFSV